MINFGKKKEDKKTSTGERKMYKAVCSNCGNKCELPFKPTSDKPVFCSDCYKERRNASSRRSNTGGKKMYQAICSNCGNRCEVPFNPLAINLYFAVTAIVRVAMQEVKFPDNLQDSLMF